MSDLWGIPIDFEGGRLERLPDHIELAAFRIVQEAVNNCARHAQPQQVGVHVRVTDGVLRIAIEDDGVGFDPVEVAARARTGEAVGLEGMRERAEIVGGTFRVDSVPGRGTRVVAELPVPGATGEVEGTGPVDERGDPGGDVLARPARKDEGGELT
jgi:signal transduction histidine kinase